jgi:hypothetical protein
MCPTKPTIKIRFTEPQIALVMRAPPNCNLDHLTELSFEFDQAGKIIDCIGTIKDGGNIDHDYAGRGLARLYDKATAHVIFEDYPCWKTLRTTPVNFAALRQRGSSRLI